MWSHDELVNYFTSSAEKSVLPYTCTQAYDLPLTPTAEPNHVVTQVKRAVVHAKRLPGSAN